MNSDTTIISESISPEKTSFHNPETDICCPEEPVFIRISRKDIISLYQQISVLWDFIAESGLWSDAKDYLDEQLDEAVPVPFSFFR